MKIILVWSHQKNTFIRANGIWYSIFYREKYTKSQPLSPTFLSRTKLFGHVSGTSDVAHRVWLVNTLTLLAPIGSPIICTWVPSKICEQWERNLTTYFSRCSWGRNVWQTPKNVCWEARDLVVTYGRWSLMRINPQVVSNEKRSTVWKQILLIFGHDRKFLVYSEWCTVVHTANIEITSCV